MAGCATIDKPIKMQNNGSATARNIDDMPFQLTRLASGMRAEWATASALGSRTYRKFFRPGQSVKDHSGSLSRVRVTPVVQFGSLPASASGNLNLTCQTCGKTDRYFQSTACRSPAGWLRHRVSFARFGVVCFDKGRAEPPTCAHYIPLLPEQDHAIDPDSRTRSKRDLRR